MERYNVTYQDLANIEDRQVFISDIKSRLFNQILLNINSRYILDNVVIITKFDTLDYTYQNTIEYIVRVTVFYHTEDLLV